MRFRPDSLEPVFRLEVGPKYNGLLDGYCENFDGDISNDEDEDWWENPTNNTECKILIDLFNKLHYTMIFFSAYYLQHK